MVKGNGTSSCKALRIIINFEIGLVIVSLQLSALENLKIYLILISIGVTKKCL